MTTSSVMKKLSMITAGAALTAVGLAGTAQAGTLIDTTSKWNGTDGIMFFGEPDTATYGQTFTVGADNILDNFTFFLDNFSPNPVKFAGYVMEWNSNKASGSILYQSDARSTTGKQGFEEFKFNTGGINLTAGKQYVAFLNASNFFDGIPDWAAMGGIEGGDTYAGGEFVFLNNGSDLSQVTKQQWSKWYIGDTAFKASFSSASNSSESPTSVPEPASVLGLMAVGAMGAGSALKRKRKQNA